MQCTNAALNEMRARWGREGGKKEESVERERGERRKRVKGRGGERRVGEREMMGSYVAMEKEMMEGKNSYYQRDRRTKGRNDRRKKNEAVKGLKGEEYISE